MDSRLVNVQCTLFISPAGKWQHARLMHSCPNQKSKTADHYRQIHPGDLSTERPFCIFALLYLRNLLGVLALHICVSEVCSCGANKQDDIHSNTHTSTSISPSRSSSNLVGSTNFGSWVARNPLQISNQESCEDFAGFV